MQTDIKNENRNESYLSEGVSDKVNKFDSHKEAPCTEDVDFRKNLFILSAPSATGKNTVVNGVIKSLPKVKKAITATTRPPRKKELNGIDYFFYTKDEFIKRAQANEFVETNFYDNNLYGTPYSEIKKYDESTPLFLIVDFNGMQEILKHFPDSTTIFLMPPSTEVLYERIRSRGDNTKEEINRRITAAKYEISQSSKYDYVIKNEILEDCIDAVVQIVKERSKNI